MTLTNSQIEGIRALRAEAYRIAAAIEVELEGLTPTPGSLFPKSHLTHLGVALQGPVDAQDLRGIVAWSVATFDDRTFPADPIRLELVELKASAAALLRWIEGRL